VVDNDVEVVGVVVEVEVVVVEVEVVVVEVEVATKCPMVIVTELPFLAVALPRGL
jgi:hypothetical protein